MRNHKYKQELEDLYWAAILGTLTPAEEDRLAELTRKAKHSKTVATMEDKVAAKVVSEWNRQHGIR